MNSRSRGPEITKLRKKEPIILTNCSYKNRRRPSTISNDHKLPQGSINNYKPPANSQKQPQTTSKWPQTTSKQPQTNAKQSETANKQLQTTK